MIDLLVSGIISYLASGGAGDVLDLIDDGGQSPPQVDLTPVVEALTELTGQGSQLIDLLSRPTETAGNELNQRAATALAHGWYDDALRDAELSIQQYPYRASAHLTGACAAIRLGRGEQSMQMLADSVKYSSNGEPEVGAVAALAAARLTAAVGAPQCAVPLLEMADRNTGSRCPEVVSALAQLAPDARYDDTLLTMWWTAAGTAPWEISSPLSNPVVTAFPDLDLLPFRTGGQRFRGRATAIREAAVALDRARLTVCECLLELEKEVDVDLLGTNEVDTLLSQLGVPLGWRSSLRRTLGRLGALDDPRLPNAERFRFSTSRDLASLRKSFRFTRRSALLLGDLFTVDFGLDPAAVPAAWKAVAGRTSHSRPGPSPAASPGQRSQALWDRATARSIKQTPASTQALSRLAPLRTSYEAVLTRLDELTQPRVLDELELAAARYNGLVADLRPVDLLALPSGALLGLAGPATRQET
ncbi:MAG TPA: hypothetical protein VFL38_18455 [Humibacillus xanthopallidus]|nr:hypothetical protein [Humibacillus xanthopallidus]